MRESTLMRYKKSVLRNISHLLGWRTKRKIVVIESDDWGSIRMPSREIYDQLLRKGIRVDNCIYSRYDSLASEEDLSALFDVLSSVRDKNRNPAVLTANTIVANPDFDKIRFSGFKTYFYEPYTETLRKYPNHNNSFKLWQQGMLAGIIKPQFHGREHLNVKRWMRALQNNVGQVRLAFDLGMFDLSTSLNISENSFMETLNFEEASEIEEQKEALTEGLNLFENIFGFRSSTFVPPCYIWSNGLNQCLANAGIKTWQGSWFQLEPMVGNEHRFKKRFHYTGQKNMEGQNYLVRNAFFEPSEKPDFDWVNDCLKNISLAFRFKKPAIIQSHRINYIGYIDPLNRSQNLKLLKQLLSKIVKNWPAVEFLTSVQLGDLITKKI